ncbi:PilZ domain-containing protein [Deltaproteobacteria bacterium TL4]
MSIEAARIFPRYTFTRDFIIHHSGKEYPSQTKDISQGGLGFVSGLELTKGDFLSLELKLYEQDFFFTGEIVVKRPKIEGSFFYGVSFFDLTENDANSIGQHYEGIESMRLDVFMTTKIEATTSLIPSSKLEQEVASVQVELKALRLEMTSTISFTMSITELMHTMRQGKLEPFIKILEEELKRFNREYKLVSEKFELRSPTYSVPTSLLQQHQSEGLKLMLVENHWYSFTGQRHSLYLLIQGPFNSSQYKMLSTYIQIAEIALFTLDLIASVQTYEERTRKLHSELTSSLDYSDNTSHLLLEEMEALMDVLGEKLGS